MAQEHELKGSSEYHISSTVWIEYDWTAYARVGRDFMEVTDVEVKYPVSLRFDQEEFSVSLREEQARLLATNDRFGVLHPLNDVLARDAAVEADNQAFGLVNEYVEDRSDYEYDAWKDRQWEKANG